MNNFDLLKERIESCKDTVPKNPTATAYSVLSDLLDYANDLQENGNDGWINIQKLPTIDRPVLLSNNQDYSVDMIIAKRRLKKQLPHSLQIFVDDDDGYFEVQGMPKDTLSSIALPSDFTHWQYLPTLPKEQ